MYRWRTLHAMVRVATIVALWGPAARLLAQQPPQVPQLPVPVVPPAEDPERLRLEAELKDLKRREQFESAAMDLKSREALLVKIIDDSISLTIDFTAYDQKLKEVQELLKKRGLALAQQQQRLERSKMLKSQALQAMSATPPRWGEAVALLDRVVRLTPNDEEAVGLKEQAERGRRQLWIYRGVFGSLVALVSIGALIGAFMWLSKGRLRVRQLEMLEGPQPGETFALEKETTSIGALAAEADWVIADPARRLSRRHCDISRSGRHYFLTDCSSNGTQINGKPAPKGEPVLLRRGDRIELAEDVVLIFR
jgi:FHA domain